jgi:hypothetical protein
VVRGLDEAHPGGAALALAAEDRFHQRPPDAVVLGRRVDRHRADAGDGRALVDERASEYLAGALGDEPRDAGAREQLANLELRELGRHRSTGRLCRAAIDIERRVAIGDDASFVDAPRPRGIDAGAGY